MSAIESIRPELPSSGRRPAAGRSLIPSPWSLFRGMLAAYARAETRWRSRRALERLDDAALRDIGLTREQALREASRPFWG